MRLERELLSDALCSLPAPQRLCNSPPSSYFPDTPPPPIFMINRQMNNLITIDSFVSGSNVRVSFDRSPPLHPPLFPPSHLLVTARGPHNRLSSLLMTIGMEDVSMPSKCLLKDSLFEFSTYLSVHDGRSLSVCSRCVCLHSLKAIAVRMSVLTLKQFALLCEEQSLCCYFLFFPC